MNAHRIYTMRFAGLYPAYVNKAARKGRTRAELDEVVCWLTGHSAASLTAALTSDIDVAGFFAQAPAMNPARDLITGKVCGVQVEAVEEPLMREIRRLDKLVDELAKGRALGKILRG